MFRKEMRGMQGARPQEYLKYFKVWRHSRPKQIRTGTFLRRTKDDAQTAER